MAVDLVGEDAGIVSLMTTDVFSISRLVADSTAFARVVRKTKPIGFSVEPMSLRFP
jgi:hypothetical protein